MKAVGLFVALTAAMTWPQARHLATHASMHKDVYFNMWRLEWFAHALTTQPARLFDANVFYPEKGTLALSDAMPVEGLVAAPLAWAGVRPVLLHNLLLLGAIALSGAAMFCLARYLTGSRGAGVVAGIIFAFAPYRFEHVMHMELQWTMWMPLAFLALHRTLDTGEWKYGLATGAAVALQMLSSIYYGVFLATLLAIAAVLLIVRDRQVALPRAAAPLAAGAALALIASTAYAQPYLRMRARVGDRPAVEVSAFSARPISYLAATPSNWFYGRRLPRERPERRLFPGTLAIALAIAGLLLHPPPRRAMLYLLLAVIAFEASLGPDGYAYSFLSAHVGIYRGLRAMARLGVFVLMFVAVLAAYGYAILAAARRPVVRRAGLAVVSLVLLAEYKVAMDLVEFPNSPPPAYQLLARQPRGVVAEFPVPRLDALPGDDPRYAYMSIFHWFPLVNGYSGTYPTSYLARLDRLRGFPDEAALEQLRGDGVQYVLVHRAAYRKTELERIQTTLRASGMAELGTFSDGDGDATVFRNR